MTIVSYAQNFEDVMLWRALGHIDAGTYLDIGAQDPVVDSVSRVFYDAGWRGVHVEPVPRYADALRADRPDERVVVAVACDESGLSSFHEIPDTGLSTGLDAFAERARDAGWADRIIPVPRLRLDALFDLFDGRDIHWMKVDVEGMEPAVLRGWGDHPARPWIVVVESVLPISRTASHADWIGELGDRGYHEAYFDGLNRFFVSGDHPELRESFEAPPNVFDGIVLPPTHAAAQLVLRRGEDALAAAIAGWNERDAAAERDLAAAHEQGRAHEEAAREGERALAALARDYATRDTRADDDLRVAQAALLAAKDTLADAHAGRAARSEEASETQRVQLEAVHAQAAHRYERLEAHLLSAQAQLVAAKEGVAQAVTDAAARAEAAGATHREHVETLRVDAARRQDVLDVRLLSAQAKLLAAKDETAQAALDSATRAHAVDTAHREQVAGLEARVTILAAELDAARAQIANALLSDAQAATTHGPPMPAPPLLTADMDAPALDLRELLEPHDRVFVRRAYLTVLGREPDPEGDAYYTARLRGGIARLQVLGQLRRSPEGRAHDPRIAGLDRAIRRHRRGGIPVLGPLFRLLEGGEGDGAAVRRWRALANSIGALGTQQIGLAHWIATQLGGTNEPTPVTVVEREAAALPTPQVSPLAAEPMIDTSAADAEIMRQLSPRTREIYRRLAVR